MPPFKIPRLAIVVINDLDKYENLLAFIVKKSAPINHKINEANIVIINTEKE